MISGIFFASLIGIAFTYAGYPLLIALLARMFPKPVRKEACDVPVTIIVVVFNEAHRIADKLRSCLQQSHPAEKLRVLIVSDGSEDETNAIVKEFCGANVELLAFDARRGKAACLNDAVAACRDEYVVFSDVRQPLDRDAVRRLLENFASNAIGAVSGELAFSANSIAGFGEGVDAYWRYEKFIRQQESAFASTVGVSGALYALRRSLWRPIPADTILDDVVIPMNVVMQGKRVVFEKRALAWDRPSINSSQERVRKVRTLAGNFQLFAMRPEFLLPWRNPIFLQLFCHKAMRLLVPLFMLLALVCNLLLAAHSVWWLALLIVQLTCYAVAIAGATVQELRRWKPVMLVTTFLLMNSFVILGFLEFLSNKDAHMWRAPRRPV